MNRIAIFLLVSLVSAACPRLAAATPPSTKPADVLTVAERVADWQLAHPGKHEPTDWTQAVFYAGVMALYDVSRQGSYLEAMTQMAQANQWQPGRRPYHADDYAVCQTYCELYLLDKEPGHLAPTRTRFDGVLARPNDHSPLVESDHQDRWSWCDALFMAPPALVRLYAATNDRRYLDFLDAEWWVTTDALYDPTEGLYYRDGRFLKRTTANGKKVFWARGNGWVYAGIVRVLQYLPPDHPSRPKYVRLFEQMTDAIVKAQPADGLWRVSLLDPDEFPTGETSGSGLFCYGLAWGINHGLLDAAKYRPVVTRTWDALVSKVRPDGMPGSVQPVGDSPKAITEESHEVYGTGAFLLAGSEVYRLAGGEIPHPDPVALSKEAPPATWCRLVPERENDFAWENDLTAFRAYGPSAAKGPENSGIDVWLKRVKYPIIEKWYGDAGRGISYHQDHGTGYDPYDTGASRGCGGTAIWRDGKMVLAGRFTESKVILRTPPKSVFELSYDYSLDGATIHEVKRVTVQVGQRLFRAESVFTQDGKPAALDIAVGLTTHGGKAAVSLKPEQGWMTCWEQIDGFGVGTGVAVAPERVVAMREVKSDQRDEGHALLITHTDSQGRVIVYAGSAWERAGEITTARGWENYLAQSAETLETP